MSLKATESMSRLVPIPVLTPGTIQFSSWTSSCCGTIDPPLCMTAWEVSSLHIPGLSGSADHCVSSFLMHEMLCFLVRVGFVLEEECGHILMSPGEIWILPSISPPAALLMDVLCHFWKLQADSA